MNDSIWNDVKIKKEKCLDKDISCDILIIGGGMAGMHTAFYLKDAKYKTVLIDKDTIGSGITSRTTAKITYLQGSIYSKIEKMYDFEFALKYLRSQMDACAKIEKIIDDYNIDCDYEKSSSYLFEVEDNLNKEIDFLTKANVSFIKNKKLPIRFPCKNSISTEGAVFHPIKYLNALKNIVLDSGIKIYENTRAVNIIRDDNYYVVRTLKGIIKARKVIICTNYPFFIIPGLMPFKLYLERSYVICGKGENKKFNAINVDKDVYSIRYYKDNIIFAGLSESLNNRENDKMEKLLQKYKKYFGYEITKKYQNHDVMTHDYLPIVGKINNNSNLLIVTGFNKWGMTNGVISGKVISDIILEGDNEYINLFDPNRKMTGFKFLNRLVQNFKISYNYIYTKLIVPKDKKYYQDTINGVKCNVYIDKDDKKYIVNRICPHMGCTVKLNEKEKTWDCQCHGSRFTIDGELINGPSVYDIKIE